MDWMRSLQKIPMSLRGTNFCINCTVHPILHRVSCSYEMIPNAPKHYETHQNMSLGSNRVDQVRLLGKLQARTIALIEPVQYVLQQVSCSYKTIPNAPKYYETYPNITLESMGWIGIVHCEKSRHHFVARIFSLIARVHRVLPRVSCRYETIPNAPKYYKGPMGWIGCVRCKKSQRHFVARTLALIAPIHPILHRVSCSYEMIPNAPKHYETHQNMSLGSNGVDQVRLLGKITT